MYFSLTGILFVSVFLPEITLLFIMIQNINNYLLWLFIALLMPLVYLFSSLTFGVIHSQVICRFFLPKIEPGKYIHGSDIAYLYAVVVVSPNIFKSLLKVYSFVPHLYSLLIGKFLGLYGLRTGKDVYISSGTILDSYLVSIGSGSLVGVRAIISAHLTERNHLILAPVTIGKNVTIGGNSIIAPGATIGDNVIIGVNSFVKKDQIIPSNTIYGGSPARLLRKID
ncbi:MAG: hypothetical protein KAT16_04725 [Candidatus Heimdallarchaeota archaeon]|nr:hypothetical protein [Candidatus Heimdallarchaeota archaeon]